MRLNHSLCKGVVALLAGSVLLTGCQMPPMAPSSGCIPLDGSDKQGAGIGAVLGAIGGGALGSTVSRHRDAKIGGALLGAIAGAVAGSQFNRMMDVTTMPDGSVKLNMPGAIVFPTNRSDVNPAFASTLESVGKSIQKYCNVTARVVGHTDNRGSDMTNDKLALDRANSVVAQLARSGIPMERLRAEQRGSHQPIAPNDTEENRAQNRRVEIFFQ